MKSTTSITAISPLTAAGSRFSAGVAEPVGEELSRVELRSFLLQGAEPLAACTPGMEATPRQTTPYDGNPGEESEDFNQPDFSP